MASFLFAAPVLLSLVLAVISVSNVAWRFVSLEEVASAVARQMAVSGYFDACSAQIASYYETRYGFAPGTVTVTGTPGPSDPPAAYGSPVTSTATAQVPLFFFWSSPTVTVAATASSTSDYTPPTGALTPQPVCGVSF